MREWTRLVLAGALVSMLAACGSSGAGDGAGDGDAGDGGAPDGDAVWALTTPAGDEIEGRAWAFSGGDATLSGSDSTPAGWTLVMAHDGPLEPGTAYASWEPTDGVGEGGLTVTITAPGGATCVVGPAETTVEDDDPQVDDTYAVAVYFGLSEDDGRPIVSFAYVYAACDDLPGSDPAFAGVTPVWAWGFGTP